MQLLALLAALAVASATVALPDVSLLSQGTAAHGIFDPASQWHASTPATPATTRHRSLLASLAAQSLDMVSLASAPPGLGTKNQPEQPPIYASKEDYRVTKLPGLKLQRGQNVYAGHLPVDNHNSTEFFIYNQYDARHSDKKHDDDGFGPEDVVVWLNGGPGASSLFGLFVENGPWQFGKTGQIRENHKGWQAAGNVLFLENPAGVGFSYVQDEEHYIKNEGDVSNQFWRFTQEFMARFPETKQYRWWVTGESFGGMYVPHIAHRILENNDKIKDGQVAQREGDVHINLSGIAIGNGVFYSPYDIPVNWIDYLDELGYLRNDKLKQELKVLRDRCSEQLADKDRFARNDLPDCHAIEEKAGDKKYILELTEGSHCIPSFYDVRVTKCDDVDPTSLYQVYLYLYMNNPLVQRALHAAPKDKTVQWMWVDELVNKRLDGNGDQPSVDLLPGLIDRIPVLMYHGDKDIVCNYVGAENTLAHMEWKGRTGFEQEEFTPFKVQGKAHGHYKKERGLTYLRMYDAGHMVPFNQPEASLEMLQRFMKGEL
ncbi:hypothetical protein RI367_006399 [Sorochytrium milnesiophthora]